MWRLNTLRQRQLFARRFLLSFQQVTQASAPELSLPSSSACVTCCSHSQLPKTGVVSTTLPLGFFITSRSVSRSSVLAIIPTAYSQCNHSRLLYRRPSALSNHGHIFLFILYHICFSFPVIPVGLSAVPDVQRLPVRQGCQGLCLFPVSSRPASPINSLDAMYVALTAFTSPYYVNVRQVDLHILAPRAVSDDDQIRDSLCLLRVPN